MSLKSEKITAQRTANHHKPIQHWHRHLVGPQELESLLDADHENRMRGLTLAALCDMVLGKDAKDRSDDALKRAVSKLLTP